MEQKDLATMSLPECYCLLSDIRQIGHERGLLSSRESQGFHKTGSQESLPALNYVPHFICPLHQCLITPQFLIYFIDASTGTVRFLKEAVSHSVCDILGILLIVYVSGPVQETDGIKPCRECQPWQTLI